MMQNCQYIPSPGQSGLCTLGNGQNQGNLYAIPTHNRFAPLPSLDEWVDYSINPGSGLEHVDVDVMRSKRRRFNTGDGQSDTSYPISHPNLENKLSIICEKLDNLERSDQSIASIAQNVNSIHAQVTCVENQNIEQNRYLKVLAYKSINIEARSRRRKSVIPWVGREQFRGLLSSVSRLLMGGDGHGHRRSGHGTGA